MANLHRVRETLVCGFCLDIINAEDFMLLYDINKPTNPDFKYSDYEAFDVDDFNDDECMAYFRYVDPCVYFILI